MRGVRPLFSQSRVFSVLLAALTFAIRHFLISSNDHIQVYVRVLIL